MANSEALLDQVGGPGVGGGADNHQNSEAVKWTSQNVSEGNYQRVLT